MKPNIAAALAAFQQMPDQSGVSPAVAGAILDRARASIWRDIASGRLKSFQIGRSRRVVVGSIRAVMAGTTA
jgi:hypothetical protein